MQNKGKIKLIVSPNLSQDDIDVITQGYNDKKNLICNTFLNSFDNELSNYSNENLLFLYQLVCFDILDIKIATLRNGVGIYHDKLGILTDSSGNNIVFYGSANSSVGGYQNNYEKIRLISDLNSEDIANVQQEIDEFENLW